MANTNLAIAEGFYLSESLPLSAQRCINWMPSVPQTSTITDANLFGAPGIDEIITGSLIQECRGLHVLAGVAYFVIGNNLIRLNRDVVEGLDIFTTDNVGNIEGSSRVFMADNGIQLCIVAPPDQDTSGVSYIFTEDPDTLTPITDPNFLGPAGSVIFIDGFFVFTQTTGSIFFNSPVGDGLGPYDPLDFSVAEADPDEIVGIERINNQLYVFGSETTQLFRNIGRAPAPFSPIAGATIDVGCFSSQSIVRYAQGIAFVGGGTNQSPSVWLIQGTAKQRLSTIAIDQQLSQISNPELIFSWVYSDNGADYLGISTPDTCFVYDIVNGRWHERQSISENGLGSYRVSHMETAYERVLVGDQISGNIGSLNNQAYLEYGNIQPKIVTSRPFDNVGNPIRVLAIEAVIESGVGLPNDVLINGSVGGSEPKITLSWSDDGGRTFQGFISRSMGKIGEFMKRPYWTRLGSFGRQRVIRFEVSSPTKATLMKVEADIG